MRTLINIIRIFFLLYLASFASTALAVTVGSELGGASLNGTWAFGCIGPDPFEPEEIFDESEFLVFQGNTVESRIIQYTSNDGSCSGPGTAESEIFDFNVIEDFESPGWLGENGQPALPPECQDPNGCPDSDPQLEGKLDPNPIVTLVEYVISPSESEFDVLYIDDTGSTWYLWRGAGEDNAPSEFMSIFEPLTNSDPDIGVIPIPAGIWLFGTALIGFVGYSRRRKIE